MYLGPTSSAQLQLRWPSHSSRSTTLNPNNLKVSTRLSSSLSSNSTSCSNQCLAFIPDLCKTILDMNWQWLPTRFRHVLTSALQFICLQNVEVGQQSLHSLCFTKHLYHTFSFLFLLLDSYEFSDLENTYFYHYLYQVDYAKGMIPIKLTYFCK